MTDVARVRCEGYEHAGEAFRRALELLAHQGPFAARGEPVLLKPNLLAPHPPEAAVTTHPAVLDAALSAARDLGARPAVADSPGFGSAARAARTSGLLEICRRHGAPLLDLGEGEPGRASGPTYKGLELAREALEARWLWNLPKWKTHTMMGLTLGVKNLYGCVPGKRKIAWHFRAGADVDSFAAHLLDVWHVLKPCLTVLDGVTAMEGAGPSRGTPIGRALLLASAHAPALDWDAARLCGFAPRDVPTIRLSLDRGLVRPGEVRLLGDPAEPVAFAPAPGSSCDWPLPGFLKRFVRGVLSPVPVFDESLCTGCGVCIDACPADALKPRGIAPAGTEPGGPPKLAVAGTGRTPEFSRDACIRCYCCQELCPAGAARVPRRGWFRGASVRQGRPP